MYAHKLVPAAWCWTSMLSLSLRCEKRYSQIGWENLAHRLSSPKMLTKLYNNLSAWHDTKFTTGTCEFALWEGFECQSDAIMSPSIPKWDRLADVKPWSADTTFKVQKRTSGGASYSVKLKIWAKTGLYGQSLTKYGVCTWVTSEWVILTMDQLSLV